VVLTVHVRPYAQRALLDGVEVAHGAQAVQFALGPGRPHAIQLEHSCCATYTRELRAEEVAGLGELRVSLEPRPALLRVEGEPSTRIFVEGALIGTAGDSQRAPIPVALPSGGDSPYEAAVRIALEAPGQPPRTVPVKLRAGGELTVAATSPED
jgi:serine/threonine-protein kinase